MKSEHRHELQTSELDKLAARITPFFERYGSRILIGFCVACLVAAGAIYWIRTTRSTQAAAWTRLTASQSAEQFANVADDFEGTPAGAWARLNEAERNLNQGIQLTFTDRQAAVSDLEEAREDFETLLGQGSVPDPVRERALYGMARCLETLSDGNNQPAIDAYQKLVADFPDSVYREIAEERIEELQTGRAQEFYAWFHKQNPKPEDREKPQDTAGSDSGGLPSGHPPIGSDDSLPELPEGLKLDDFPASPEQEPAEQPSSENGDAPSEPSGEQEAGDDAEPAPPLPEKSDGEESPQS